MTVPFVRHGLIVRAAVHPIGYNSDRGPPISSLLLLDAGFHPDMTGRQNTAINVTPLGMAAATEGGGA